MAQRDRHVLIALSLGLWLCSLPASASETSAVVLPAVTPLDQCPTCTPLRPPAADADRRLVVAARQLETALSEAVQDLGLTLDVSADEDTRDDFSEAALTEAGASGWVFSPRVTVEGSKLAVRILAIAPGSRVVLSRTELVAPAELEMHAAVMMRDLVQAGLRRPESPEVPVHDERDVVHAARSAGRAVLALNSAALGGYFGYSLQRAGGSDDARLTYPLIALGTGIGLGGSMIVADEWDVGVGDAWYLSAGMWWPTLSALLLAGSYDEPDDDRFLYGLAGAGAGLGLATVSLTFGGMPDGGAVLAHSGGAYGTVLGGLVELLYEGRTDVTPARGMGYGAGIGVLAAGTAARLLPAPSASRLMLVDLSIALGGLTGAAVASPLVFGEDESKARNRYWLASVATGFVAGGLVGFWLTDSSSDDDDERAALTVAPYVTVHYDDEEATPVAGFSGQF